MGCNCTRTTGNPTVATSDTSIKTGVLLVKTEEKTRPTEQCIACAQKHFDECWIAFNECGYESANRRFVRGSLRAIVLHTFREWPEIGKLARECALLIQEAKDAEAVPKMERLGELIDAAFLEVNPETRERIDALRETASGND